MDIKCPKCGEPWDFDTLHEETATRFDERYPDSELPRDKAYDRLFRVVREDFTVNGCKALGSKCNTTTADPAVAEIYALLGDDIDGAAALLEDFGL